MELLDSVRLRKSIRAFKADSMPLHVLFEVLSIATRAPSSTNLQPWEFFIITGEALEELRVAYVEQFRQGVKPHPEIYFYKIKAIGPQMQGIYRERQVKLAKQMFKLLNIAKKDEKGVQGWYEKMYRFYDAPAIILIGVDKTLLQGSWYLLDVGLVIQNIALVSQEYGLGTCIIRASVDYPEQIREIVGIPESKTIIIGISIGYPDREHPINQLRSEREPINDIVTVINKKGLLLKAPCKEVRR